MLPEIIHRCPSCGASIRELGERAMFCPECGKSLVDKAAPEKSNPVTEKPKAAASEPVPETPPKIADNGNRTRDDAAQKTAGRDRQKARERTRETLQRASSRARGAIEDNVKRVEKIHHVSTVMLEEATYDPSLRFVLVAVGLFMVFVILLILTKVMG